MARESGWPILRFPRRSRGPAKAMARTVGAYAAMGASFVAGLGFERLTGDTAGYGQIVPLHHPGHDALRVLWHTQIGAIAGRLGIPAFNGLPSPVLKNEMLASYSIDYPAIGASAAGLVEKLFKGEKVADIKPTVPVGEALVSITSGFLANRRSSAAWKSLASSRSAEPFGTVCLPAGTDVGRSW